MKAPSYGVMLLKLMLAVAVGGSSIVMLVFNQSKIASMAAPFKVGMVC